MNSSAFSITKMAIHEQKPHFVLLPFMAPGHMTPMVDIARLLADRGVKITILTTPLNAKRFSTVISRAMDSGMSIHLAYLKFPCAAVGLPEGCENLDMVPSIDESLNFFKATAMLQDQVQEFLQKCKTNCLIADFCFTWATNVCLKLGIPRIVFHGMSCFGLLCLHLLASSNDFEAIRSYDEYFVVPGLPGRIELTKAQLTGTTVKWGPEWKKIQNDIREAEVEVFGTVANTFVELEPEYVEEYSKTKGKKVWCIGPVSLCNKDDVDKVERGNKSSVDEQNCLKWLEFREKSSVIYVCLGSLSRLTTPQLVELGLGLEASNQPFVWVVRNVSDEFEKWLLEENYEERIKERGLLIHGWAPQVLILSHPSVGGFLTHCGWNSTLEGVSAGVPMITWPLFADQFCNEKLVVCVTKTAIKVGAELPVMFGKDENMDAFVKNNTITMAINELFDGGQEGEERRGRARKLGEMAKTANYEGGSSYFNLTSLIRDISMWQPNVKRRDINGVTLVHENPNKVIAG